MLNSGVWINRFGVIFGFDRKVIMEKVRLREGTLSLSKTTKKRREIVT